MKKMTKLEQFAKDYLEGQDEIKCTADNIELLASAIAEAGIDIDNINEDNQHDLLNAINDIAMIIIEG